MENSTIAIIIIALTIISFAVEKIPLAVTAMISALAMALFGIIQYKDVSAGFASTVTMMVAGMLICGNALFETGAAKVLGAKLLKSKIAQNERAFLMLLVGLSAFLSAFFSNSATVALFIPVISAVAMRSKGTINEKSLIMAVGMGAAMGGCGTLVGSTAQLIGQGILLKTAGATPMGFFDLAYVVGPMCIILMLYFGTIGYSIQKKVFDYSEAPTADLGADEVEEDVKITWQMVLSTSVMILCVLGFIFKIWNVGIIALVGATILLASGCIDFKKSMRDLDWNTLIILSAAQGFAKGLDVSGGGRIIANKILELAGGPAASAVVLLVVGIVLSTVLTNFMSNTALVAMLAPIFIPLAFALHVSPTTYVLGVIIGSSTALATPIGTPALTQTLVAGYRWMDYVKVGLPITIILTIVACILTPMMYGL
ncbi:MAG: SLC13 family permease [Acidaminococcaceae bacterium]